MTELHNLTVEQLRKLVSIKEEIESLNAQLDAITGGESIAAPVPVKGRGVYKRSKAARAVMAAAQKARGAKLKVGKSEAAPKKRWKMSAAGRARIAAAAKARWANYGQKSSRSNESLRGEATM
jgi:hypothetical protein